MLRRQPIRTKRGMIDLTLSGECSDTLSFNSSDEDDYAPVESKKKQPLPKLKLVAQPDRIKEAPFRKLRNVDAIYAHMSQRVKEQPTLYNIASTISAAVNQSFQTTNSLPKVHKLTLAGVSGTGKTETVLTIKHYLGMDTGYEYDGKFVFLDGSTLTSDTQVNSITGAAPGLTGYRDGNSLADRLNAAIGVAPTPSPSSLESSNGKKKTPLAVTEPVPPPPRFVLLVIDELDKVSIDFLKAVNGLIETGDYKTPDGVAFIKPNETSLIIMFTCNYGERELVRMPLADDELAESYILADMRKAGVPACTIGRLGDIYPFYALEHAALQKLLAQKLHEHIQRTPLATTFGKNKRIVCKEEVTGILVAHVLNKVASDLGVRGAIKQLFRRIDVLFEKAYAVLSEMPSFSREEELEVTRHRFNIRELEDSVEHELSAIIDSIKKNPANAQTLALCRSKRDETLDLDAMGLRMGKLELCHFVMPVTVVIKTTKTTHYHYHNHRDDSEELQELKQRFALISRLAKEATPTTQSSILAKIREATRDTSEEDDDEGHLELRQSENVKKRKAENCFGASTTTTTTEKKIKYSLAQPVRYKPLNFTGLTPAEHIPGTKRSLYM